MEIQVFRNDYVSDICILINQELGYNVSEHDLINQLVQMWKENNYAVFIAVENQKVIGFIGLQLCLAFEIPGKIVRIIALAVSHEFQRRGVGSKLLRQAEGFARDHGASILLVNSGLKRKEAHQFYENQQFYRKGYSFCKKID